MGILDWIWGKSPEERNIEREMRHKKAVSRVKNYISKLESLQKQVYRQGKEAAAINDHQFVKRQAAKYMGLQERIRKGQRILLLMEEARVQKELANISGDFITFAKDISDTISEAPEMKDIASMQVDFEKAMGKVEEIDEAMSTAVELASESILSSEEFSEETLDEVASSMEGEAAEEEAGGTELDQRISKGIEEVERKMKGGQ